MSNRRMVLGAAAAVGLIAAGSTVAYAGSSSANTIKGQEKFTKTQAVDVGKKGTSVGDRFEFASVLRKGGTKLADSGGSCIVVGGTSDANAVYHCTQSYQFSGGQVDVQGLFSFADKKCVWGITGGSGKYRGASGQATFVFVNETTFNDVFEFDS